MCAYSFICIRGYKKEGHVPQEVADNMPSQTTGLFPVKTLATFSLVGDASRPLQGGDNVTSPPQGPRLLREKMPPWPALWKLRRTCTALC